MTWTKLGDEFFPEICDLTDGAALLHIKALGWSNWRLLDLVIPHKHLKMFGFIESRAVEDAVEELISEGWWQRIDSDTYWIGCRFADWQTTKAEVRKLARMNATQQANRGPNKLELAGYAIVDRLGVPYERQVMFNRKFTPDATIPSARLVVQFDGEYWHDRAGTNKDPALRRQVQRDRAQDAYIRKCGWEVIRFWETDIHRDPDGCADRIRARLRDGAVTGTPTTKPSLEGKGLGTGSATSNGHPRCEECGSFGPLRLDEFGVSVCVGRCVQEPS